MKRKIKDICNKEVKLKLVIFITLFYFVNENK